MSSRELRASWKRTEGYLRDARSHLSQEAEAICNVEIGEFDEFIEYNELGLAFEALVAAFEKSEFETWRVLELLALAAASMGMLERQVEVDQQLSKARGWTYETVLPKGDA